MGKPDDTPKTTADGPAVGEPWEEAVRRALKKKRPKKGWPKPKKKRKLRTRR